MPPSGSSRPGFTSPPTPALLSVHATVRTVPRSQALAGVYEVATGSTAAAPSPRASAGAVHWAGAVDRRLQGEAAFLARYLGQNRWVSLAGETAAATSREARKPRRCGPTARNMRSVPR